MNLATLIYRSVIRYPRRFIGMRFEEGVQRPCDGTQPSGVQPFSPIPTALFTQQRRETVL